MVALAEAGAFHDWDVPFGHALAERIRMGVVLTGKQRRSAHRTLAAYEGPLESLGLRYPDIPVPGSDVPPPPEHLRRQPRQDVIRVVVEDGRIWVRSPFQYKEVCKSIPQRRWNAARKAWTYPESPTSAAAVRDAFVGTDLQADEAFEELVRAYDAQREVSERARTAEDLPPVPRTRTEAWGHQRQAFWFARDLEAAMLAMDMGTGKSKVAVDLVVNADARQVLVLCPVSVMRVWPREFRLHAGAAVDVLVVSGNIAQRVRDAEEFLFERADDGRCRVVVTNYEGAAMQPFAEWSARQEWDYLILDESHRIKAVRGVRSSYASKVARRSRRRLALTGTPMAQTPLDVFGQYRALDPSVFGVSWTSFRNRYAVMGGYGGHEVVAYQRQDELHEKFYSIAFRVTADVLDLPPEQDVTRSCTLGRRAEKVYRALERDAFAEYDTGEVTAANVLVKLLRLQQLTGGALKMDDGPLEEVDDSKERLLQDVLEDIDEHEPVVVFCRFVHDLDVVRRVAERLDRPYAELSGRRGDLLDEDARMEGWVRIAAVQIQSGGVGIDLTAARYAVYYSLGYSLTDYEQSRRRVHRPGQDRPTFFVHLVAAGTKDEDVYRALQQRKEVVEFVLTHRGEGSDGEG